MLYRVTGPEGVVRRGQKGKPLLFILMVRFASGIYTVYQTGKELLEGKSILMNIKKPNV